MACVPLWAQAGAAGEASTPASQSSAVQNTNSGLQADQADQEKAKSYLLKAIHALGGQAYLGIHDIAETGRGYSFHHGTATSNGILFWRFVEYPDKERIELTEQRDVSELYVGDTGTEITYKGPHAIKKEDLDGYLRRRKFSLSTILRKWVNDPKVALFYEGYASAAEHTAYQIELINAQNESVKLFLDSETYLPVEKSFWWRDPVDRQKNVEEEIYDDYRPVQNVMTPFNFTRLFNGDMAAQRFLNTVAYNKGLDEAMFDPTSGYDPNKPERKH